MSRWSHIVKVATSLLLLLRCLSKVTANDSRISPDNLLTTTLSEVTTIWTMSDGNLSGPTPYIRSVITCPPLEVCQNGFESGSCPETDTCDCSLTGNGTQYFWGATCNRLNLTATTRTASRTTVTFTWEMDPEYRGNYQFVYRKSSSSQDQSIHTEPPQQINKRSVRLINLYLDTADYVVCLMDQELAGIVYTTKNTSRLDAKYKDCMIVNSQSSTVWSQQLAFYLICAGMGLVLLIIFFVGCVKESLDKRNYHLFDTGVEQEEHEVDDVQDISSDKDEMDNTCAIDETNSDIAMEAV